MVDKTTLKNLKIDEARIEKIGFTPQGDKLVFSKKIIDDEFLLTVEIRDNVISSNVVEIATDERYALFDVEERTGAFIGRMRSEYDSVVNAVKNECCSKSVFKTDCADAVIRYIRRTYGDELEYLWEKFPHNAVVRNKINEKWYAAFLVVDKRKIGIDEDGQTEIVNVLVQSERLNGLVDGKKYFYGYHMNKKHWISVILDGSVAVDELYPLVDNSYQLSVAKRK